MALGFNQAGLLFATSRKSTVERKAMGIANDKIALARESQALSEDYARGQNLRKLVWEDAQGVQNDLRFSAITAPFSTGPTNYIMTNVGGKMIVDSAMMKRFGLTEDTGHLTMSRNAFLAQFDDPFAEVKGTKIDPTKFKPKKGITLSDAEIATMLPKTSFDSSTGNLEFFKETLADLKTTDSFLNMDDDLADHDKRKALLTDLSDIVNTWYDAALLARNSIGPNKTSVAAHLRKQYDQYDKEVTFFSGIKRQIDAVMSLADTNKEAFLVGIAMITRQTDIDACVSDKIEDDWGFMGGNKQSKGIAEDLANAFGVNNSKRNKSDIDFNSSSFTLGIWSRNTNDISKQIDNEWFKNLTNTDMYVTPQSQKENVGTQDYVDYYDTLWKHLTYKGWIKEDRVNDPKFLENSLRSGGIYIEKQDVAYSFSRIAWQTDPSCALRDVRDKTGVNLVQVQYEARKNQLDQKESMLDVDLRNLDMERASLEAQIDTLKAVITKNVERSFKMFQA